MYSQVFGCIYLQCPALPQAVPGTAFSCTRKPGYTYKKEKLSICIARFSGASIGSARHCLKQCWALHLVAPENLAIHIRKRSSLYV